MFYYKEGEIEFRERKTSYNELTDLNKHAHSEQ